MTVGVASRYRPIVIGLMVMSLAGELLLPVIPQDQNYIEERVNTRAGALLLWLLLTLAVFSLLLWRWTDDLRLYAWMQFFPFLAMLLILGALPEIYRHISLDRRCV
jgi:hypothetical protein